MSNLSPTTQRPDYNKSFVHYSSEFSYASSWTVNIWEYINYVHTFRPEKYRSDHAFLSDLLDEIKYKDNEKFIDEIAESLKAKNISELSFRSKFTALCEVSTLNNEIGTYADNLIFEIYNDSDEAGLKESMEQICSGQYNKLQDFSVRNNEIYLKDYHELSNLRLIANASNRSEDFSNSVIQSMVNQGNTNETVANNIVAGIMLEKQKEVEVLPAIINTGDIEAVSNLINEDLSVSKRYLIDVDIDGLTNSIVVRKTSGFFIPYFLVNDKNNKNNNRKELTKIFHKLNLKRNNYIVRDPIVEYGNRKLRLATLWTLKQNPEEFFTHLTLHQNNEDLTQKTRLEEEFISMGAFVHKYYPSKDIPRLNEAVNTEMPSSVKNDEDPRQRSSNNHVPIPVSASNSNFHAPKLLGARQQNSNSGASFISLGENPLLTPLPRPDNVVHDGVPIESESESESEAESWSVAGESVYFSADDSSSLRAQSPDLYPTKSVTPPGSPFEGATPNFPRQSFQKLALDNNEEKPKKPPEKLESASNSNFSAPDPLGARQQNSNSGASFISSPEILRSTPPVRLGSTVSDGVQRDPWSESESEAEAESWSVAGESENFSADDSSSLRAQSPYLSPNESVTPFGAKFEGIKPNFPAKSFQEQPLDNNGENPKKPTEKLDVDKPAKSTNFAPWFKKTADRARDFFQELLLLKDMSFEDHVNSKQYKDVNKKTLSRIDSLKKKLEINNIKKLSKKEINQIKDELNLNLSLHILSDLSGLLKQDNDENDFLLEYQLGKTLKFISGKERLSRKYTQHIEDMMRYYPADEFKKTFLADVIADFENGTYEDKKVYNHKIKLALSGIEDKIKHFDSKLKLLDDEVKSFQASDEEMQTILPEKLESASNSNFYAPDPLGAKQQNLNSGASFVSPGENPLLNPLPRPDDVFHDGVPIESEAEAEAEAESVAEESVNFSADDSSFLRAQSPDLYPTKSVTPPGSPFEGAKPNYPRESFQKLFLDNNGENPKKPTEKLDVDKPAKSTNFAPWFKKTADRARDLSHQLFSSSPTPIDDHEKTKQFVDAKEKFSKRKDNFDKDLKQKEFSTEEFENIKAFRDLNLQLDILGDLVQMYKKGKPGKKKLNPLIKYQAAKTFKIIKSINLHRNMYEEDFKKMLSYYPTPKEEAKFTNNILDELNKLKPSEKVKHNFAIYNILQDNELEILKPCCPLDDKLDLLYEESKYL